MENLDVKFKQAEDNGRLIAINILKQYFGDNFIVLEAPDKRYWDIDIWRTNGTKAAIVEIKYRHNDKDTYDTDILTDGKYTRLMNTKIPSYYISIYQDGYYRIYNVKNTPVTESMKYCNHITIANDGKVAKKCYEFDHKYSTVEGIWKS